MTTTTWNEQPTKEKILADVAAMKEAVNNEKGIVGPTMILCRECEELHDMSIVPVHPCVTRMFSL